MEDGLTGEGVPLSREEPVEIAELIRLSLRLESGGGLLRVEVLLRLPGGHRDELAGEVGPEKLQRAASFGLLRAPERGVDPVEGLARVQGAALGVGLGEVVAVRPRSSSSR